MEGPCIQQHLALLLVNRQVHQEAMPVFYQNNLFYFWHFPDLSRFVSGMSTSRLSQLRRLFFDYGRSGMGCYGAEDSICMTGLAAVVKPSQLVVNIDEKYWYTMSVKTYMSMGRQHPFTDAQDIPGMQAIAIMARKARKLEVYGDCPKVKEYLEDERQKAAAAEGEAVDGEQ